MANPSPKGFEFGFKEEDAPKIGDAITVTADGKAKRAEPGEPIVGYAYPEATSKRSGKTLMKVFSEEAKYKGDSRMDLELQGYRPKCARCGRGVDRFDYWREEQFRAFRFRAQCHGNVQQIEIPDETLYGYDRRTSIIEIIEAYGFFRADATEAIEARDKRTKEILNEEGMVVAKYFPKKGSWIMDEIDEFPNLDKTQEYRRLQEKMKQKMMAQTMALMTAAPASLSTTSVNAVVDMRYTTSSSSGPSKPTKSELLAMLAEIEKTEAKPAMLELGQERVIDL
jgi:hypothetical protein